MVVSETVLFVMTSQNTQDIKFIVLALLFIYSILGIFLNHKIDTQKSYMHFWLGNLTKIMSYIYIIFSPLTFLLLLNLNITMEMFVLMIAAFYLMFIALFIGMSIYQGSSEVFKIFGYDDWNEFKDERKARKSLKKYG